MKITVETTKIIVKLSLPVIGTIILILSALKNPALITGGLITYAIFGLGISEKGIDIVKIIIEPLVSKHNKKKLYLLYLMIDTIY